MCTEAEKARGQKREHFFADIDYSAPKDGVSTAAYRLKSLNSLPG